MNRPSLRRPIVPYIIVGGVLLAVLGMEAYAWQMIGGEQISLAGNLIYWGLAILLAFTLAILSGDRVRQHLTKNVENPSDAQRESLQRRLDGMVRLNQLLIDAQDEKELVEKALEIIAGEDGSTVTAV